MELPLVSIVTPSYNQGRFLERTIRSVLEQDYPHIEYLIMDGGSTDGSVEIIRTFSGQIDFWESKPDEGQADAINRGWQRSNGEIIAWLNSDDTYKPGAIEYVADIFFRNPGMDVITADCTIIDADDQFVRMLPSYDFRIELLLAGNSLPQPGVFCRRERVEEAGWLDSNLHYVFDWKLWLTMSLKSACFYYLPKVLAHYRSWGKSKTAIGGLGDSLSGGVPFALERLQVLSQLANQKSNFKRQSQHRMIRTARYSVLLEIALLHHILGDEIEASRYLTQMFDQGCNQPWELPYPEAMAVHLAYVEQEFETIVDSFQKLLAAIIGGVGPNKVAWRWRRNVLAETYLVKAWLADYRGHNDEALSHSIRAMVIDPALMLERRVVSPTLRRLGSRVVTSLSH